MNRYKKTFKHLSNIQEGCFIPFVVLGDPSMETSIKIIDILINNGADALEIGIPFSDPLADGPTIQNANLRALSKKHTFLEYFYILTKLREKYLELPIGLLTYANLIYNQGIDNFYLRSCNAGLDSVLIADVPIEEYSIFYKTANRYKINSIFICPPDADDILLRKISLYAQGYIYLLSHSGITGIRKDYISLSKNLIKRIQKWNSMPLIQGFGVSHPLQIRQSISLGISGVICGSVIINVIEQYLKREDKMMIKIQELTKTLKNATQSF